MNIHAGLWCEHSCRTVVWTFLQDCRVNIPAGLSCELWTSLQDYRVNIPAGLPCKHSCRTSCEHSCRTVVWIFLQDVVWTFLQDYRVNIPAGLPCKHSCRTSCEHSCRTVVGTVNILAGRCLNIPTWLHHTNSVKVSYVSLTSRNDFSHCNDATSSIFIA